MRHAVIDVGSNTVRAVVYETDGKEYISVANDRAYIGLLSYIKDNALTGEGKEALISVLGKMVSVCVRANCEDIHCFATASLRNVSNSEAVLSDIKKALDLELEIIEGKTEAFYDFAGLKSVIPDKSGVGLDLGGGSCQLFHFENNSLVSCRSFPIGSLKLYEQFVKGNEPDPSETAEIENYVRQQLLSEPSLNNLGHDTVFAMGGTARSAAMIHSALTVSGASPDGYELTVAQLKEICGLRGKNSLIARLVPERAHTVIPGLISLYTVCGYTGAEKIKVVIAGVREGYLHEKLLKRTEVTR